MSYIIPNSTNKAILITFSYLKKIVYIHCSLIFFWTISVECQAQLIPTKYHYDSGVLSSEGFLENGQPNGYWKTYFPNGQLKSEGNRKDFKLDSLWSFYSEQGIKTIDINYAFDLRNGVTTTYKEGVKYEEVNFEFDKRSGDAFTYYPTGEVEKRMSYVEGQAQGMAYEFDRDGRIITLLEYRNGDLKRAEKINRFDSQGKKRGLWMTFHSNGQLDTEGTYMNNLRNGIFKSYDKQGDLVSIGKYIDDVLQFDNPETVILDVRNSYYSNGKIKSSGGYVDGMKEGIHRVYSEEGEQIGGELYKQGELAGKGIVDTKGDYQGEWKLYFVDGELKAEGNYVNSKREGDWTFYFKGGKIESQGKYVDGLVQGLWKWNFENGQLRRTEFYRRGKEDGDSEEYDEQGNVLTKGQFVNGLKEGEWFYKVGDHLEEGPYLDGERHGTWVYKYPDGQLNFTGEFVAGLPVGKHKWYFPNGQLKKEGKYSSGVRSGTWNTYNEDGTRSLEVKYKNGLEQKINGQQVTSSKEKNSIDLP